VNIDLLLTGQGEAGLLCDDNFEHNVAGVMFDAEGGTLSLEFSDMDSLDLNIPVEGEFIKPLLYTRYIQMGSIINDVVSSSNQIPVLFINDPYGKSSMPPSKATNSVLSFESFLKNCITGQPVHRDDFGNEATIESVVSGVNTAVLQFAPQLARQRALEAAPKANPSLDLAPKMGPGGPGGGASSGPVVSRGSQSDWED
jgi:hypothetical protein